MIEKTRCSFRSGWQYAKEVQEQAKAVSHWVHVKPEEMANFKIETELIDTRTVLTKRDITTWIITAKHGDVACYVIAFRKKAIARHILNCVRFHENEENVQLFTTPMGDGSYKYLMRRVEPEK